MMDFCRYENFQSCSVKLTIPVFEQGSLPIACQAVTKLPSQDYEETISLCLLAWRTRKSAYIFPFDINQCYKEQMPHIGDWRVDLNYLASFSLKDITPLDVWMDGTLIAPFNSI